MTDANLTCSIEELKSQNVDVLVIGSGPAGVAVLERLFSRSNDLTIGLAERGSILTLTHINNIFPNKIRRSFIDHFKITPWEGSFQNGGMLLPALGGRGIAAGAHLRRFDDVDFGLWGKGIWPDDVVQRLPEYYKDAEISRHVNASTIRGPAQTWCLGTLHTLHAHAPTVGVDLGSGAGFDVAWGYDSSVARLWRLLIQDRLHSSQRRLFVATNTCAAKIEYNGSCVQGVECFSTMPGGNKKAFSIAAKAVVIAASTIESARLFLLSQLNCQLEVTGRYLAEHIERRAKIEVDLPTRDVVSQGISVIIPPDSKELTERFQIHLRGQHSNVGKLEIDIGGFAAMDPSEHNCVTLSENRDEYDIPKAYTHLLESADDQERSDRMCRRIQVIGDMLDGTFVTERFPFEVMNPKYTDNNKTIQKMDPGRSYHEAGTLRMGADRTLSVTNSFGQVHGIPNLYVADAALFPCVGIANPMLTITALAYRVADRIVVEVTP